MRVKNISARMHHIGNVSIAPGEEKDIQKGYEKSIREDELVVVRGDSKGQNSAWVKPSPEAE